MTQEEKAKRYDEALEELRGLLEGIHEEKCEILEEDITSIFPELKESNDEKIRKSLIILLQHFCKGYRVPGLDFPVSYKDMLAWLEKQDEQKFTEGTFVNVDDVREDFVQEVYRVLDADPTNDRANQIIDAFDSLPTVTIEKQGEKEQLYIRFGKIPNDEKSKIYYGEIEVGTENGVSVYPAFKTDKGDIVLGLMLPITKTTLYTQQHLIEYDDRPCYLVKGDYVGKDTDGQPLINNVSIIEKIDSYRTKEEKQSEQKPQGKTALEAINEEKVDNANKVDNTNKDELRFHIGDWVITNNTKIAFLIKSYNSGYYTLEDIKGNTYSPCMFPTKKDYHRWSIADAEPGDILASKDGKNILIFKHLSLYDDDTFSSYYSITFSSPYNMQGFDEHDWLNTNFVPATKEQCDLLFQKMHEAGYEYDEKKQQLRKMEYD